MIASVCSKSVCRWRWECLMRGTRHWVTDERSTYRQEQSMPLGPSSTTHNHINCQSLKVLLHYNSLSWLLFPAPSTPLSATTSSVSHITLALVSHVCVCVCVCVCVSVCLTLQTPVSVCLCTRVSVSGASMTAYMTWFTVNKTSGQLTLSHALHRSTLSSVDLVVKATDDCWSGYWHWHIAGARHVTWTARDTSLLLVRVTVVMPTRFTVTSLYAGVVTQAQAGHDVVKLAVTASKN